MARGKNSRRKVNTAPPPIASKQLTPGMCSTCYSKGVICKGECMLNPASFGHKTLDDVQRAIDYHWKIMPEQVKYFLLTNPSKLCLKEFVDFYSRPDQVENTSKNAAASITGCSWYLSLHYMFLGKMMEARGLILNAAFLQEVFNNKPVTEIAALCDDIGSNSVTGVELKFRLPFFHDGLFACSSQENMLNFLRNKLTPTFIAQTSQASKQAQNYVDYISSCWEEETGDQTKKQNDDPNEMIEVILVDSDSDERCTLKTGQSATLKTLFNKYADQRGVSLRSFRFSYDDKTLFLSSAGQKTPLDLGIKNLDIIVVSRNVTQDAQPTSSSKSKSSRQVSWSLCCGGSPRRGSSPGSTAKKIHRRASWTCAVDTDSEEYTKIQHSNRMTRLFDEAEPIFSKIRQDLNLMSLERAKPKAKSRTSHPLVVEPINNPCTDGLGGKAGKPFYNINVGQLDDLYKTSKSCTSRRMVSIDLHGYTRDEALRKLDESLPEWMNAAMKGEYPFVSPVMIVCGGGSQILSETVENWIRENGNVANAPKRTSRRRTIC